MSMPPEEEEIATAIRTLTEIRRVMTINSLNALVIRGTAEIGRAHV